MTWVWIPNLLFAHGNSWSGIKSIGKSIVKYKHCHGLYVTRGTLSLFSFFSLLFFVISELALLDTHEYVFIATAWHLRIRYYVFCVLTSSHTQVTELTITLVQLQLLQCAFCLHNQITNKSANLDSWQVLWEFLDWNAIKIDEDISNSSWLCH